MTPREFEAFHRRALAEETARLHKRDRRQMVRDVVWLLVASAAATTFLILNVWSLGL